MDKKYGIKKIISMKVKDGEGNVLFDFGNDVKTYCFETADNYNIEKNRINEDSKEKEEVFNKYPNEQWKEVSEEEFKLYVKNYPRKLEYDWTGISDPPLCSYNDFTISNRWPYSMVAKFFPMEPGDYYGWDAKTSYYIREDIKT